MSREKKILAICLAISAISTIIMVVNAIISPETSSLLIIISTGIVPVVLCSALLSSKKDDKKLCDGYFIIALVLGEKAKKVAEQSSIPEHIKKAIASAASYAEGKTFFVEVKNEKDLEPLFTLIKIKEES